MNKIPLRLIFLLPLFIFSANILMAQRGVKIGGYVLPNYTTIVNSDDAALDPDLYQREFLNGMGGGFVFGYNPSTYFGLRMNVAYSQQGGRFSVRNSIFDRVNFTTRLEYLKIPLMMGLHTNHVNRKVVFSLYGGFQFGLLVRAWEYDDNTAFTPPNPPNFTDFPDVYDRYAQWNHSIVTDMGFDIKLLDGLRMNVHARADFSILDAEDKEETFRITENGFTRDQLYWEFVRGISGGGAETKNVTIGLLFGITYTLPGTY